MKAEDMRYFIGLSFAAFAISLCIARSVYLGDRGTRRNTLYAAFSAAIGLCNLLAGLAAGASSPREASVLFNVAYSLINLLPPLFLNLAFAINGFEPRPRGRTLRILVYALNASLSALILLGFLFDAVASEQGLWLRYTMLEGSPLPYLFFATWASQTTIGLIIAIRGLGKARPAAMRKANTALLALSLPSAVLAALVNVLVIADSEGVIPIFSFLIAFAFNVGLGLALGRIGYFVADSDKLMRLAFASLQEHVLITRPDYTIVSMNESAREKLEMPPSNASVEAVALDPVPLLAALAQAEGGSRDAPPVRLELELRGKGGKTIPAMASVQASRDDSGVIRCFVLLLSDMSEARALEKAREERLSAERALAASEYRLEAVLDVLEEPLAILDSRGRFAVRNRAFDALSIGAGGIPSESLTDFEALFPDLGARLASLARDARTTAASKSIMTETVIGEKPASFEIYCSPLYDGSKGNSLVIAMRDRTARKREEDALERAERVKSLGLLAGGIAHDFNNILGGILGNLSLGLNAESLSEAKELMAAAEKAAERAKSLTSRLLELSKASHPIKRDSDLEGLAKEVLSFCTTGTAIDTNFTVEDDLPAISFDRSQLGNALENLMLNAVQALGGKGRISVRIRRGEPEPHGDRKPWVEIVVEDDGPGIPPDKREKVFEPYFTTKEGGSGLGLALALSIARKHGGDLMLESPATGGCRFVLKLPVSEGLGPSPAATIREGAERRDVKAAIRPMTIVLMDDDELVREPLGRLLSRRGHTVHLASNGEELIAMLERDEPDASAVDAAVLDLTVRGGMGGAETLRNLRARGYAFPCIACSGYASAKDAGSAGKQGFAAFVPKPAKAEDIEEAVFLASRAR